MDPVAVLFLGFCAYMLYKNYGSGVERASSMKAKKDYMDDDKVKGMAPELWSSSAPYNGGAPTDNLTNRDNMMMPAVQVMNAAMNGNAAAAAQYNQLYSGDTLFATRIV
jgi:hypothetical protein